MSSPDVFNFKIDRDSDTAIYLQIAMHIINLSQRGLIDANTQVPGTRVYSQLLKVHRKTVIAAYQELELQGWITAIPNKGSFINIQHTIKSANKPIVKNNETVVQKPAYPLYKNTLLEPLESNPELKYMITDGLPDIRIMPIKDIASLYSATLKKNINKKYMGYNNANTIFCKQQLCNYLHKTSGLKVKPQNLLITRSFETANFVTAATLLKANDHVVVGDVSYYVTNMILQQSGAKIISIPTDKDGLKIDILEELCIQKKIRMVHIMPSSHYPTTASLSAERKVKLLQLAKQYGFIILEDEFEFEFNFDSPTHFPLINVDSGKSIVYIGTFGKFLPPGYRITYTIAAEEVIVEMEKRLSSVDNQGNPFTELVIANFIAEGNAYRLQKKNQKIYKEKRDVFLNLIQKNLHQFIDTTIPSSGLAVWLSFKHNINLFHLSEICKSKNLWIPKFLLFQNKNICGMRIGFGDLEEPEMKRILTILQWGIRKANC